MEMTQKRTQKKLRPKKLQQKIKNPKTKNPTKLRLKKEISTLLTQAKMGRQSALAKLLTIMEKTPLTQLPLDRELLTPKQFSLRIGITGPPGAGKSTLVGQMIKQLRKQNLRVGVIAIDPSSPFTHGAILGDRIRYSELVLDPGVFIRSLGTRGSLGGLSSSAYLMLRVFDAVGFDVVLVETVGVGQTELEIMNVADEIVVVLVPEAGDSVQAMKAGLMEIAHVFVVNKSDRPGAGHMKRELEFIAETTPDHKKKPLVIETIATQGEGVNPLVHSLLTLGKEILSSQERISYKRLQAEAYSLLRQSYEDTIRDQIAQIKTVADLFTLISSKKFHSGKNYSMKKIGK